MNNLYKAITLLIVAGIAAMPMTGCWWDDDEAGDVIKIGFAGPLSGTSKEFGVQAQRGAELYIEEINNAGGIDGKKVELVVKDDQGKAPVASQVAVSLVGDKNVVAIIGHLNSRCTQAGREAYNEAGVTQVTYGSTNVDICKGWKYTFRNIYRDDFQGIALARFVKNKLKLTKVSCYYENDAYGEGLFREFKKECEKIGLKMVHDASYAKDAGTDYATTLLGFKSKGAQVIFISGAGSETATIAKEARKVDPNIQILSGDGSFLQAFIDNAGSAAEGAIISGPASYAHTGSPEAKAFADAFQKKFGEEPSAWSSQAYDAVKMIAEGIKKVGTDREKIREYIAGINSPENAYKGVGGDTYFDKEGDPVGKPVYFFQIKNGKFTAYKD